MPPLSSTTSSVVRVAIDVAKLTHQVLLELPTGKRRSLRVPNTRIEIERLVTLLRSLDCPCDVAFEPTGDYHRPLAYILGQAGCRRSRSLAREMRCTTRGTRTTRRMRKSFCI